MSEFEKNLQFNQAGLEQIKTLYQEKQENYKQNNIETKEGDKEVVRDVINDLFDKAINKKSVPDIMEDSKKFSVFNDNQNEDEIASSQKIEEFVKLAFDKGIAYAINLSFKTSNAYTMDRLHDVLVDMAYEALIDQKIIKK